MSEYLNPIAELGNPDSGEIITAYEAYQIRKSKLFYCPDYNCRDQRRVLFPKKSSLDNYFFSHSPNCGHDISPETLLHKSAIKWFVAQDNFEVPIGYPGNEGIMYLDKNKTIPEYRELKEFIPDVRLTSKNGFDFGIEIVVTNDITDEKNCQIQKLGLPMLRIDLQDFYHRYPEKCRVDLKFITHNLPALMADSRLKSWINLPVSQSEFRLSENGIYQLNDPILDTVLPQPTSSNPGCLLGIFILLAAVVGIKVFRK